MKNCRYSKHIQTNQYGFHYSTAPNKNVCIYYTIYSLSNYYHILSFFNNNFIIEIIQIFLTTIPKWVYQEIFYLNFMIFEQRIIKYGLFIDINAIKDIAFFNLNKKKKKKKVIKSVHLFVFFFYFVPIILLLWIGLVLFLQY